MNAGQQETVIRIRNWVASLDIVQVGRHFAFAGVAGVLGSLASIVLCLLVEESYDLFLAHRALLYLLPALGIASLLLYRLCGLPLTLTTEEVVAHLQTNRPVSGKLSFAILLGTALTILGGGSVGKEAGALQMGASLGQVSAQPFKLGSLHKNRQRDCTGFAAACGMASCFSALFFAPLGSALFVLEFSRFDKTLLHRIPALLIGCFTGFAISKAVNIGDRILPANTPPFSGEAVFLCLIVGLACGVVGMIFSQGIKHLRSLLLTHVRNPYIAVFAGGLIFIALIMCFDWVAFTGTGSTLLTNALKGEGAAGDFAIKLILTMICLGFGFKGGEIMPMFTIGSLLGLSCSLMLGNGETAFCAALGLVSFFAAASKCPLAAILIGCETLGWTCLPYLVGVAACSFGTRLFCDKLVEVVTQRFGTLSES